MFYYPLKLTATLIMLLLTASSYAMEHAHEHHDHHEDHNTEGLEAHIHGIAELFVILEAKTLSIEFHSPAMNIVGFEHPPKTQEQKSRISNARTLLSDGENLFQFSAGHCMLSKTQVNFGKLHTETEHQHEHHAHHKEDQHSNIEASYQYKCEESKGLRGLSTKILKMFPGVESLQVQWIIKGNQGATTLNHSQSKLTF